MPLQSRCLEKEDLGTGGGVKKRCGTLSLFFYPTFHPPAPLPPLLQLYRALIAELGDVVLTRGTEEEVEVQPLDIGTTIKVAPNRHTPTGPATPDPTDH